VLSVLLGRVPEYHRIQHVYVHHVEDNGPRDSESTTSYDRTSFLDFSRHAFLQGFDMLTGAFVFNYLRAKGKKRQLREMLRGFLVWYAVLAVLALFNPIAALFALLSRFVGGNIRSLISFWQHGLVDPEDVHDIHGNSVDFVGHLEHGNLGADYHVEHHLQPGRHWSAYYEAYAKQAGAEGGHAAVVMQKEMFGPLAFVAALWRKDYLAVARYARLRGVEEGNDAELARIVAERTRPIDGPVRTGLSARIDGWVGRVMSHMLPTTFGV
jgi:fatty acid desaturase